jgi:DNA mismatch repair protein MutS
MALVSDYLSYTEKWKKEYGEKTLVLMQVGSFYEVYALLTDSGEMIGSNILEFSTINDMVISKKNTCVGKQQVVMAGFGVPQLEKYTKKLQEQDYTIVVYKQDIQGKNTTRSLAEIISPGTYFSQESTELSNNTMCIWLYKSTASKYFSAQMTVGISNIDIFTGKTSLFQYSIAYNHNPSTYDELERYIAIYKPSECLIVSNINDSLIKDIISFIGLECGKIHKISLDDQMNDISALTGMNKFAKNAEKQIYQQEVFKKFYPTLPTDYLLNFFPTHFISTQSFCFLLDFVYQHSPNLVRKLSEPVFENHTDKLVLANHSLRQLNINDDSRHKGKLRSVSSFLNNCVTTMGKRRFAYDLQNPITNITVLNESYEITDHLLKNYDQWNLFRTHLSNIKDIEKLNRKIVLHKVSPKDFALLCGDLTIIRNLYDITIRDDKLTESLKKTGILNNIKEECVKILHDINSTFCIEKCASINEVSVENLSSLDTSLFAFINKGVDKNIDELMRDSLDGREKLEAIRLYFSNLLKNSEKSAKTTDYIKIHETPKNNAALVGTSIRVKKLLGLLKQTTGTGTDTAGINISYISTFSQKEETFSLNIKDIAAVTAGSNKKDLNITNDQIEHIASDVQKSKDKLINQIIIFYNKYLDDFLKYEKEMDSIIRYTTFLDILQSKCYIASKYNYCKPTIDETASKAFLAFTEIRHPLIEHLQTNELYVTNDMTIGKDMTIGCEKNDMNGILLYGTNAVGKTSFIKSLGIAVIMAQAGLYVPCKTFNYFPYSSIFTRILGNDNIFKGLSTFAVEMTELRTILTMSDKNSLVLGDELCSGTESDSALSIFTAGLETLHVKECTFLFATHFHEIVKYEEIKALTKMKMMHMEVSYDAEKGLLIYDRKLRDGPGDSMYGLEVCKSLNLPQAFLRRAHDIRMKYKPEQRNILSLETSHYNSKKIVGNCELCDSDNKATEVHHLQYQKNAKKENAYIETFHKNHLANLINICEDCHQKIHKENTQHKIVKTSKGFVLMEL